MRALESFTGRHDDRRLAFIKDGVELRAWPPPVGDPESGGLRRRLLSLLDRTDVTFRVGGETFAARSSVVDAASPEDDEGASKWTACRVDAVVFKALLYFMYTGTLPPPLPPETMPGGPAAQDDDGAPAAAMAQQLVAAADRFHLDRLDTMRYSLLLSSARSCGLLLVSGDINLQRTPSA
ncbi:uncharacterized protein LOC127755809 [Oryza glaberrima]|uniref:uncharacterized protein LOC127755809 n=1 Tax=Oryza glaberrima TaxID=4538 RepID=UPI00224BF6A5|nr:uncharacterized protein LOC127755809 [Oryza glaberrima]